MARHDGRFSTACYDLSWDMICMQRPIEIEALALSSNKHHTCEAGLNRTPSCLGSIFIGDAILTRSYRKFLVQALRERDEGPSAFRDGICLLATH